MEDVKHVKLTGVGVGNLISLVGVEPDLLLATAQDAGGEPLLEPEHAGGHQKRTIVRPSNQTQPNLPLGVELIKQQGCNSVTTLIVQISM